MKRHDRPSHVETGSGGSIGRLEAAHLLRASRSASPEQIDEAVDWAFAALPDRKHARLIAIRRMLHHGDTAMADAQISQGLLQKPTDPSLTLLHAQSLFMQGQPRRAEREIRLVLKQRPQHKATLLLAAEIADTLGQYPDAIDRLERALERDPDSDLIKSRLVQILLNAKCVNRAREVLRKMKSPMPVLEARVLREQGRIVEATDLLETARQTGPDGQATSTYCKTLCELIDLLEHSGSLPRLRELLREISEDPAADDATKVRVGKAYLTVGEFRTAARRMAGFRRKERSQPDAMAVLVVAAAMLDRMKLAELALARLQRTPVGANPRIFTDLWRRAQTARLFLDQHSSQKAGADRNTSLLRPLMQSALDALQSSSAGTSLASQGISPNRLAHHQGALLTALGRVRDAAAVLARSMPDFEPSEQVQFVEQHEMRKAA